MKSQSNNTIPRFPGSLFLLLWRPPGRVRISESVITCMAASTPACTISPCSVTAKWVSVALYQWLNHSPQFVLKHSNEGLCSWRTVFKGMLPQKHENIPRNGYILIGRLPLWLKGKESACRCRRCRFHPWIREDTLKEMATHSSILDWEVPWTESLTGYSPGGRMT